MRLSTINVLDSLPVRRFEAHDLADVVVLAGPNGVGKTRLLQSIIGYLRGSGGPGSIACGVAATVQSEIAQWGKEQLDLQDPNDLNLLRITLQASRRRKNWTSSLINFESDRSIQNLQPLQFSWDMADPDEEAVSWDMTFGFMRDRFQDTVHSLYRMIEAQKQSIAGRAIQLKREGRDVMNLAFSDPMDPFKEIFSLLLSPKQLVEPSPKLQRLEYTLDGKVFDFTTLSSGEREVVNIAFDFQLRKPQDCIVFFDEPELHLHPELSYKLISTLRRIGARNQFILSTHSPDVITASLDQSVIFLSPPRSTGSGEPVNQAIAVSESDETNQALRLLGQSIGIVSLGKRIVLIEGEQSSLDKQTYGSIVGSRFPELVLVPSGGKHVIESFAAIYDAVLSRTIWGVEFFMLCDRDTRPAASPQEESALVEGRLRLLPGYHVENEFLDEEIWAAAFSTMEHEDSWLRDPSAIRGVLRELASGLVPYATALSVAFDLRRAVGNIDVMPKGVHGTSLEELQELIGKRVATEQSRLATALDSERVNQLVANTFRRFQETVDADDGEWKRIIPGKPLLGGFAGRAHLHLGRAKSLYISAALSHPREPFREVLKIFEAFAAG